MSLAENEAGATQVALTNEFHAAIDDARERVAAVLAPACPTAAFLAALREEVQRAVDTPESMPYPELADADMYWEATVKPQSRSLRDSVAEIVSWLEQRIITTMEVAETDMKSLVDNAAADAGADTDAWRSMVSDEIERRCLELHHQMAEVLTLVPSFASLEEARQSADDAIRVQAGNDVEGLKAAYLNEAGGDDDHQHFAAQQWSETFADRVAHRHSMLAAEPPWRHQEFALVGYERTRLEVERLIEEAATRLQAPLVDVQQLLLERFDKALFAAQA